MSSGEKPSVPLVVRPTTTFVPVATLAAILVASVSLAFYLSDIEGTVEAMAADQTEVKQTLRDIKTQLDRDVLILTRTGERSLFNQSRIETLEKRVRELERAK